jgi:hypothetical protein
LAVNPIEPLKRKEREEKSDSEILRRIRDAMKRRNFFLSWQSCLKTPHMDRRAKEGADFTDFHCTPVCTPTEVQDLLPILIELCELPAETTSFDGL